MIQKVAPRQASASGPGDLLQGHHLVVLRPGYLRLICAGRKRMECRVSRWRIVPYGCVHPGDVLWLKRCSGPISAVTVARRVLQFEGGISRIAQWLQTRHANDLQAEPDFWRHCRTARFGVVLWLGPVLACQPFNYPKRDRRGWMVLPRPPVPTTCRD